MAIAAKNATRRLVIAAINAAANAPNNNPGGRASWRPLVCPGAPRIAVIVERAPAIIHATVDIRRTHTPDRRAESAFSAIARNANPYRENRRNSANDPAL